jgi:hypothetical protein
MRNRFYRCCSIIFVLLLSVSACREFEPNSFTTFTGAIVDEEGRPIAGVELFFVDRYWDFDEESSFDPSQVLYQQRTNALGEFRFIVPTRNFDGFYGIGVLEPDIFLLDFFGEEVRRRVVAATDKRGVPDGVVNLGLITLVRP